MVLRWAGWTVLFIVWNVACLNGKGATEVRFLLCTTRDFVLPYGLVDWDFLLNGSGSHDLDREICSISTSAVAHLHLEAW